MSDLTRIRIVFSDKTRLPGQRRDSFRTKGRVRPLSCLLRRAWNHDTDEFDRARRPHAFGDLHDAER